jgi:hypothetical protein
MKDNDFYLRLLGIAPTPSHSSYLSDLLGLNAPKSLVPLPAPRSSSVPPVSGLSLLSSLMAIPDPPPPLLPTLRVPTLSDLARTASLSPAMSVPSPAPTGIKFVEAQFSEPMQFGGWLPKSPGLYAILVWDLSCRPRPFRAIYFGMASDIGARVGTSHEKYDEWMRCAGMTGLYTAHHRMPGSTERQRADLEARLITRCRPDCNVAFNPVPGIFGY